MYKTIYEPIYNLYQVCMVEDNNKKKVIGSFKELEIAKEYEDFKNGEISLYPELNAPVNFQVINILDVDFDNIYNV